MIKLHIMDYSSYIKEAFGIAKDHGFHDVELPVNHFIMLIVTEISEMVEADRKNKRCRLNNFDKAGVSFNMGSGFVTKFENKVKDTLEDEMADVVIRLCDFCGSLGVLPYRNDVMVDMSDEFAKFWGDKSVCEQCFYLSSMVVDVERVSYDADDSEMRKRLGSTLSFIFEMANYHCIDLLWHVDRKMEYNESRPRRHGKSY